MKDFKTLTSSFQAVMNQALELEQQHVLDARRESMDVAHDRRGGAQDDEYQAALLQYAPWTPRAV